MDSTFTGVVSVSDGTTGLVSGAEGLPSEVAGGVEALLSEAGVSVADPEGVDTGDKGAKEGGTAAV